MTVSGRITFFFFNVSRKPEWIVARTSSPGPGVIRLTPTNILQMTGRPYNTCDGTPREMVIITHHMMCERKKKSNSGEIVTMFTIKTPHRQQREPHTSPDNNATLLWCKYYTKYYYYYYCDRLNISWRSMYIAVSAAILVSRIHDATQVPSVIIINNNDNIYSSRRQYFHLLLMTMTMTLEWQPINGVLFFFFFYSFPYPSPNIPDIAIVKNKTRSSIEIILFQAVFPLFIFIFFSSSFFDKHTTHRSRIRIPRHSHRMTHTHQSHLTHN